MSLVSIAVTGSRSDLIRFLFQQAVRIKGLYLSCLASWSSVYALPLLIGSMTATLIDKAGAKPMDPHVEWLLMAIIGLMILRAVVLLSALQFTFKLIFKTSAWIKIDIIDRLLRRPSELIYAGSGEILNRLRDDSDELGGLLEWTTDLIYRSTLSIFAIIVLTTTDLVIAIPLLFLLSGLFISVLLKNKVAALQLETRHQQGRIEAAVTDTLKGIRDLRFAGTLENHHMNHLEQKFTERRGVLVKQQFFADLLSDLFRNLMLFGTSVVLLTMSFRVQSNGFEVGKLVLFLTYSSWLSQQMYFFGKILARYQNGKVALFRLNQLHIDDCGKLPRAHKITEPLREFVVEGLIYGTPTKTSAPAPITFKVRPGELVAITGKIGAGKSLVLRSLLGLNPAVDGRVFWNEIEITGNYEWMRSPRVAYASQSPRFLRGSLRENIKLGSSQLSSVEIEAAMRSVQLNPGSAELLQGADTQLDSGDALQLSGGQRQRLALARMLVSPAELFLVDDCDSSIDSSTARRIWQTIKANRNAAWIVVSQNPVLLELSDRVITIMRT